MTGKESIQMDLIVGQILGKNHLIALCAVESIEKFIVFSGREGIGTEPIPTDTVIVADSGTACADGGAVGEGEMVCSHGIESTAECPVEPIAFRIAQIFGKRDFKAVDIFNKDCSAGERDIDFQTHNGDHPSVVSDSVFDSDLCMIKC